jgi:hypothetical protein
VYLRGSPCCHGNAEAAPAWRTQSARPSIRYHRIPYRFVSLDSSYPQIHQDRSSFLSPSAPLHRRLMTLSHHRVVTWTSKRGIATKSWRHHSTLVSLPKLGNQADDVTGLTERGTIGSTASWCYPWGAGERPCPFRIGLDFDRSPWESAWKN